MTDKMHEIAEFVKDMIEGSSHVFLKKKMDGSVIVVDESGLISAMRIDEVEYMVSKKDRGLTRGISEIVLQK